MNRCQKCQAELPIGARYCTKCGSARIFAEPKPGASAPVTQDAPQKTPDVVVNTPLASLSPTRSLQPSVKHIPEAAKQPNNALSAQAQQPAPAAQPGDPKTATPADASTMPKPLSQPVVLKTQIWTEAAKPTTLPEAAKPVQPKAATQATPPEPKPQPGLAGKIDQNQANVPGATQGKTAHPGFIRSIEVASSSKPAASSAPPAAQPAKMPPAQQKEAQPILPPLAALGVPKQPTPLPPVPPQQRVTPIVPSEKPAPAQPDMATQVTRKDAAILAHQLWAQPHEGEVPTIRRGEIIRTSTLPPARRPPAEELPIELEDLPIDDLPTGHIPAGFRPSSPRLAATSKVAEHWRDSWRDRQRAEAGPAVGVSRGQASVPMPLMAMQHSIARMRAIVLNNKQTQHGRSNTLGFWMTLLLMICLIGGLSTYIISTFLTTSSLGAARITHLGGTASPSLTVKGAQTGGAAIGQILQLHGDHFGPGDTINFYLDSTTQITATNGQPLTAQSDGSGSFNVSCRVDSSWSVGPHLIQAQDRRTQQTAYVNIEVSLNVTPETSSPNLQLSTKLLKFTAIFGEGNPAPQKFTLTNTSGQPLQWSVTATADDNLSWLIVNQNQTNGSMNIDEQDTLSVSVLTAGLAVSTSKQPYYSGHIIFTINGKELLTLPVQLVVEHPVTEMSFSPDPIIGHIAANGTCAAGTTLTLINLSNEEVHWSVTPDSNFATNIKFVDNAGNSLSQGFLDPSGSTGPKGQRTDITVLTLRCSGVKVNMQYHISIYANNQPGSTYVIVQP
jgi:hypothetical protein